MPEREQDPEREHRIAEEIIVDAYGPEEQALGWYYYLESASARCSFAYLGNIVR
jgi:hypothetical protein